MYVISQIIVMMIVLGVLQVIKSTGKIDINSINSTVAIIGYFAYAILAGYLIKFVWKDEIKDNIREVKEEKKWKFILTIVITSAIIIIITMSMKLLYSRVGIYNSTANNDGILGMLSGNKILVILTVISAIFVAPIIEELIYRLAIFKIINNVVIASIVSILVFSFIHVVPGPGYIAQFILYLPTSIVITLLYARKKNIIYTISLHFLNNLIAVTSMLLYLY